MLKKVPEMFRPVPVADFMTAQRIVHETYSSEGGERSTERTCSILIKKFKNNESIAHRIMTRMHAFRHLYEDPRMRAWKIEGSPGQGALINGAILCAIAETAFVQIDGDWKFDPNTFFDHVLRDADHDGEA